MLLFVYGSLRAGMHNHYLLNGATSRGVALSVDPYVMIGFQSRAFPYLLHPGDAPAYAPTHITGELYDIQNIAPFDELESHPHFYCREQIAVRTLDGTVHNAWCYILVKPDIIDSVLDSVRARVRFDYIGHGDWTRYCAM